MICWEYRVEQLSAGDMERSLNRIGENGWELVTLWFRSSSDILAFFKRPYNVD